MIRIVENITARQIFLLFWFAAGIGLVVIAPRAAVNVDEQLHYPHAKKVIQWYLTAGRDTSCLDTPVTNLKYYGQSADNLTALINHIFRVNGPDEFLVRHYTGAFFFWMLLLFAGILSREMTGNYKSSVIAILALIFMPRLSGHAFGNLKDIPFATGYLAGILMTIRFLREMPSPKWKTTIWLAIAIAFTCSVRIGGLILFAYLGLFLLIYFVLKPFELKQIVSTKPCLVRLSGQGAVILLIGYFGGLLFWPYALQDIFVHPLESLGVMEHYMVSIRQVFEGKLYWSTQLPWYYLPMWLFISTPEFIITGLVLYIFVRLKQIPDDKNNKSGVLTAELITGFSFLFPIFYVMVIDANLYSGVRQMIFILPVMALVAVTGIYRWFTFPITRKIKYPVVALFLLLMLLPARHQAMTFPADYVYFNSLSGGNKNAWSTYEYDYYFHALKKPAEYLNELVKHEQGIKVALNCNLTNYFSDNPNIETVYSRYLERSSDDWDYGLFGLNYIHPYLLKNNTWPTTDVIRIFYHRKNPVAVLLKRRDKSALTALRDTSLVYGQERITLLENAVQKDPNDVWLLVHLAKANFYQKNLVEFQKNLERGKKIHPFYEPLYLLEAQKFFSEGEYARAGIILDQLLEINPRYQPMISLLQAVKEKRN